jgi:hypothetical protein
LFRAKEASDRFGRFLLVFLYLPLLLAQLLTTAPPSAQRSRPLCCYSPTTGRCKSHLATYVKKLRVVRLTFSLSTIDDEL